MSGGGNRWASVPGIVTGAAGLLTAIVGLLTVSVQLGWIGGDDDPVGRSGTSTTTRASTTTAPGSTTTTDYGSATGSVAFDVNPDSLEFSALGGRQEAVTLRNTGSAEIRFGPFDVEGAQPDAFAVDATTCTLVPLAPGRSCELPIRTVGGGLGGRATATLIISATGTTEVREVVLRASGLLG